LLQGIQKQLFSSLQWHKSRPQWPRGLSHELSSLARTQGSCVRISLKAWISMCIYSVCVVLFVGSCLATCSSPVQGVLPTVYRTKNWKSDHSQTKGL
jgi:hypothetical protein